MIDECVLVAAAQVSFDFALLLIGQRGVKPCVPFDSEVASAIR